MKHSAVLACVWVCGCSVAAQAELVTETYANGKTKVSYTTNARDQKHGKYYEFYEDGKSKKELTYVNDRLTGIAREFHPNGERSISARYRNGVLHGPFERRDEKGKLVEQLSYVGGKLTGRCRFYTEGKLTAERVYIASEVLYPKTGAAIRKTMGEIAGMEIKAVGRDPRLAAGEKDKPLTNEQVKAMRTLMTYRYLSGVPWRHLVYDRKLIAHADEASRLLEEIGQLDHHPKNPGWPEAEYKFAYEGTSKSNLSMGSGVAQSIHGYMDDSDPSNIDRVGHRRWCLNPSMGKTGIAGRGRYSAMWSFDRSNKQVPDFQYVAYPAPGIMPISYFGRRHAWSVSVNPRHYGKPSQSDVKVVVRPVRVNVTTGQVRWGEDLKLDYLGVDLAGMGIANCIIFRPEELELRPGATYEVEISGLPAKGKVRPTIRYFVEFAGM